MSRSKGNRNRRKIEAFFRAKGFLVANVEKSGSKWLKERDLFSTSLDKEYNDRGFDSIALSKGNLVLIQCKTNVSATKGFYKDFAKEYADEYTEVLVTTFIDRKGTRFQWYQPDGSIIEDFIDIKTFNQIIKD